MNGHGVIINLSSGLPFVFTFNPESITQSKKVNRYVAPNTGGSSKQVYFAGFDPREISLKIVVHDNESPLGVKNEIAFFKQLSEPDPGLLGVIGFGNENYPPPKVLFQFGVSSVPLEYEPEVQNIEESHFYGDSERGIIGIPRRAEIGLKLVLDESSLLYRAEMVAEKALLVTASALSIAREARGRLGKRKEQPGIYPAGALGRV